MQSRAEQSRAEHYNVADNTVYENQTDGTSAQMEGDKFVVRTPKSQGTVDTSRVGTGTASLIMAIAEARKGKGADGGGILTSAVLGLGSIFGGLSYVAKAADIPPTSTDTVKSFEQTDLYRDLVKAYGKDTAKEIVVNIYAGWTPEKIIQKYVKNKDEKVAVLAMLAQPVDASKYDLVGLYKDLRDTFGQEQADAMVLNISSGHSEDDVLKMYKVEDSAKKQAFYSALKKNLLPESTDVEVKNAKKKNGHPVN